ncbi:MAG: hypothetical protein HW390_3295 [Candidatus Brocadiaceae bacterium]|nr:hypothetical protein [Candidatus Brocadiaceae bacterium]
MGKGSGKIEQSTGTDTPFQTGEGLDGRKRYIITFAEGAHEDGIKMLSKVTSMKNLLHTADCGIEGICMTDIASAGAVVFDNLGITVVTLESEDHAGIVAQSGEESSILAIEPEGEMYALGCDQNYIRGYRDGVNQFSEKMLAGQGGEAGEEMEPATTFVDTPQATWGIQATNVLPSRYSGKGIKVAILDTGFDFNHPDFAGRLITPKSFITGVATAQDGNGHGTHVTGTACGPKAPRMGRRYGIAYEAQIFIGKVLSDAGSGYDTGILAGIDWAITNGCAIVSMSLGGRRPPVTAYEVAAQRGLTKGTLIIAATGNDSNRPTSIQPVTSPANSKSIMGVASLDQNLGISYYSNAGGGKDNFMKKHEIIVTVDSKYIGKVHEIAKQCRSAGMKVDQVLESTGIITGQADQAVPAKLARMKTILSVEESGEIELAPPDSEIQ